MSLHFPPAIEALVDQFNRLPGVGRKSAQRMAFYILSLPPAESEAFGAALANARKTVRLCACCQNLADSELCPVCADPRRDRGTICVVSDPKDVAAIERAKEYKGHYHVLHGALSPLGRVGPDELKIKELVVRVSAGAEEVILATDPDTEGETTALYLGRLLKPFDVTVTRLAYGISVGGHLEHADELTLAKAIEGRRPV
jgi:recombination protein RecR